MKLPPYLESYRNQAERLLKDKQVKHVEFSGPTYQVQVSDPELNEDAWAFLQLDQKGELKDCFCSCHDSEDQEHCVHIAASLLEIYKSYKIPLHVRFQNSFWNGIFKIYALRFGDHSQIFKIIDKRKFIHSSPAGKVIFSLETFNSKTFKFFKDLIYNRSQETEETSLKFSNLSQEELYKWREGNPSPQLSYELSFWNDLAKYLMLLQDDKIPFSVNFDFSEKKIPNFITFEFPEFKIGFYLSEANLPSLIPFFKTIPSPLKVHDVEEERINQITFDKQKGCFILELKHEFKNSTFPIHSGREGIKIGRWLYVEKDGFYAQDLEGLLSKTEICQKDIPDLINQYLPFLKEKAEGFTIHEMTIPANYFLEFDSNWNLHICCYVFEPGDLLRPGSFYYHEWVFIEEAFYHLSDLRFNQVETIIPSHEVPDFVRNYRSWLDYQEGFEVHLASIESQLTYQINENNQLIFMRKLDVKDETLKNKDFGPWIYILGQGFYSKVNTNVGLPLQFGVPLRADQIPIFIRMNQDELKLVPGFFSEKCPVVKSGIHILLDEKEEYIHISPDYVLLPEYKNKDVRFFDDFVYVKDEGFHELPIDTRLPEKFHHPVIIEVENFTYFLDYELENIKSYASLIDPRLESPKFIHLVTHKISRYGDSKGWYEMKLSYQTEKGLIPLTTLAKALKKKKRFLFTEEGLIDLKNKRFDWVRLLAKDRLDKKTNQLIISTVELIRLNAFEDLEILDVNSEVYQESTALLTELTEFRIPTEPDITGLKSSLRAYQEIGLRWLWFLYQHMLSGLLCDDMGLGKTHQTMALFAAILNERAKYSSPPIHFLIVCPTSVIYHWQEKLQAFLPQLKVVTYHGGQRNVELLKESYDILVTSYGIWRLEHDFLSQIPFEVAIFDEIQIAKNHHSRIHTSLLKVDAQMRLGLTGTPIENHLRELKALFDIVLPFYMPGESDFRSFFIRPIEKEQDYNRKKLLTRFIKPFMLRRKKEDVLLDLPEKIEEISHCSLSHDQVHYYNEVLAKGRAAIMSQLEDRSQPIPYVHIFSILSSLKQICDHPAVYLKDPSAYKETISGKWELFVELLNEARESSQKVVVFSQYLMMLDIIEDYLNDIGVGYASIRGSTIHRGEQLEKFNKDPDCEVFVASLQATGLGIDLTAGSVVIHYDRWWNAARENQATDRVYRIGQKRGVQVFKLVTKDTFEEKIDALIAKKGLLMEEIVSVDDQNLIKQFSREDIIQLLQTVHVQDENDPPKDN